MGLDVRVKGLLPELAGIRIAYHITTSSLLVLYRGLSPLVTLSPAPFPRGKGVYFSAEGLPALQYFLPEN
jgi:hypothetical protein